jgi:hypothetical protein
MTRSTLPRVRRGSSSGGGCLTLLALLAVLAGLAWVYTRSKGDPAAQPPDGQTPPPAAGTQKPQAGSAGSPGGSATAAPQGPTLQQQIAQARNERDAAQRKLRATQEAAVNRISDSPAYAALIKELEARDAKRREARAADDLKARADAATGWLVVRQKIALQEQAAFDADPRVAQAKAELLAAERKLNELERTVRPAKPPAPTKPRQRQRR